MTTNDIITTNPSAAAAEEPVTNDDKIEEPAQSEEAPAQSEEAPAQTKESPEMTDSDMERLEAEIAARLEEQVSVLPAGPEKVLRGKGMPALVYKMVNDEKIEIPLSEVVAKASTLGVYFSAGWCGPCKEFTPKLVEAYNKINSEVYAKENEDRTEKDVKAFEMILITVDKEQEDHDEYFKTMPWLAADFNGIAYYRMKLCDTFSLESIPTLLIIDAKTGEVNTSEGVDAVTRFGESLESFPWAGHTKSLATRAMEFVSSKLHLFAIMAFMLFRNYTAQRGAAPSTATITTTTTIAAQLAEKVIEVVTDEL